MVASAKMLGEVPDKKPTSVDSTIVGRATIVVRVENNASAYIVWSPASPAHFSASFESCFSLVFAHVTHSLHIYSGRALGRVIA